MQEEPRCWVELRVSRRPSFSRYAGRNSIRQLSPIRWTVSGCTVGAVTMGLRVTGRRGGRVSPLIALIRSVACVLFPVGLLWVAVDPRRRSIQDIVLGTRVVYVKV